MPCLMIQLTAKIAYTFTMQMLSESRYVPSGVHDARTHGDFPASASLHQPASAADVKGHCHVIAICMKPGGWSQSS